MKIKVLSITLYSVATIIFLFVFSDQIIIGLKYGFARKEISILVTGALFLGIMWYHAIKRTKLFDKQEKSDIGNN